MRTEETEDPILEAVRAVAMLGAFVMFIVMCVGIGRADTSMALLATLGWAAASLIVIISSPAGR